MNNINPTLIVVAIFALVLILAILKFTGGLSAGLSALGVKLTLKGQNSRKPAAKPVSGGGGGIRRNWLFGRVTAKTGGGGSIDDNTAAGSIDLGAEEGPEPSDKTRGMRRPRK